jgi:hypothetical protein
VRAASKLRTILQKATKGTKRFTWAALNFHFRDPQGGAGSEMYVVVQVVDLGVTLMLLQSLTGVGGPQPQQDGR